MFSPYSEETLQSCCLNQVPGFVRMIGRSFAQMREIDLAIKEWTMEWAIADCQCGNCQGYDIDRKLVSCEACGSVLVSEHHCFGCGHHFVESEGDICPCCWELLDYWICWADDFKRPLEMALEKSDHYALPKLIAWYRAL